MKINKMPMSEIIAKSPFRYKHYYNMTQTSVEVNENAIAKPTHQLKLYAKRGAVVRQTNGGDYILYVDGNALAASKVYADYAGIKNKLTRESVRFLEIAETA